MHHQCGIGWRCHPAGGKVDHRQALHPGALPHQFHIRLYLPGHLHQLQVVQALQASDLALNHPHVQDRLAHISRSRLALGPDHGGAFFDAPAGLAQIPGPTDEGDGELGLLDVKLVRRGKHLGLIDHIHSQSLQYLGLHKVAYPGLGHDWNADCPDDGLDNRRISHPGHATHLPDICRDGMKSHHRYGTGLLSYDRLLGSGDIHDHTALLHLCETAFEQFRTKSKIFKLHELPQMILSARLMRGK